MFGFFKKPPPAQQPSLDGVDLDINQIPGAIQVEGGLPRVQWRPVGEAAKRYGKHPAYNQIWTELAAQWLGVLRRHLGEPYDIYEGKHLLLFSPQAAGEARRVLGIRDDAYERLDRLLARTDKNRGFGKHVILMLGRRDLYYDYISYFYSESDREHGTSAGIHISRGYRHTAVDLTAQDILRTMVHELAHDIVFDRPLPRWLNEGFAQFAEGMIPGYGPLLIDVRQVRLHRRYWSWFGMDHFWDGRAFLWKPSQRVSYQLSEILYRNLAGNRERRRNLGLFLATADRRDAGNAACRQAFGCRLSELVEEFLGDGDWEPKLNGAKEEEQNDEPIRE